MRTHISYNTILIEQINRRLFHGLHVGHLYQKRRETTVHQTEHSAGEQHKKYSSPLNASIKNVHDPDVRYLYLKGERSTSTKQNQSQLDVM